MAQVTEYEVLRTVNFGPKEYLPGSVIPVPADEVEHLKRSGAIRDIKTFPATTQAAPVNTIGLGVVASALRAGRNSLGDLDIDALTVADGISEADVKALKKSGFDNIEKIRMASAKDLVAIKGIGETKAAAIMAAVGTAQQ